MRNPFIAGRPIKCGEPFCGRQEEIGLLEREISSSNPVVLHAMRRFGKTSLLNQVAGRIEAKGWKTVRIDMPAVTGMADWTALIDQNSAAFSSVASRVKQFLPRPGETEAKAFRPLFRAPNDHPAEALHRPDGDVPQGSSAHGGERLCRPGFRRQGLFADDRREVHSKSSCLQNEIDMQSIKRELDTAIVGLLKYAGIQKRTNVTVNRLHVTPQSARSFTNGHCSRASQQFEQLPSLP